jgi:hypothetical protein
VTSGDAPRFTTIVFLIWGGLLTWAGYFLFVYVFAALACARHFHHVTVAGIGVVTLATFAALPIALAITLWIVQHARRRIREDASRLARFLAVSLGSLALLAMVWIALPVLILRRSC